MANSIKEFESIIAAQTAILNSPNSTKSQREAAQKLYDSTQAEYTKFNIQRANEIGLNDQLDANTATKTSESAAVVAKDGNLSEKNGPTGTSIYSCGNVKNIANSGIRKSNQNVAHACDSSTYAGMAIAQVGAFGGRIVKAARDAIKAVLTYFGVNPSSNGLVSQLKKIKRYIQDATKFIKEITDFVNGFIYYVNAIKQLLTYILSLPTLLLKYFADCISTLKKQLVSSFKAALGGNDPTDAQVNELTNTIKDIQSSIKTFTQATATLAATTNAAVLSTKTLAQIQSGDQQKQAAATQEVFNAAGFSSTDGNFAKP
jgi:uncharacterized protein YoxC